MQTKGRALFNLLRMNWVEDSQLSVEPWQVENYRTLPLEKLFEMAGELNISLDKDRFVHYATSCESPEELTEALWLGGEDPSEHDRIYLIVFELWRRLQPEKQSLSLFCDELDYLIDLYDRAELPNDEPLQTALSELARILDESVDRGQPPKEVFQALSEYCAHDLEAFIYDLAASQIDLGNNILASELVDGFFAYVEDNKWFEFLHARLMFDADEEEAHFMIDRLMERLQEEPDFELLLEIARFMASKGSRDHFFRAALDAKPYLQVEEDFQELLALSCEFLPFFDQDEMHEVFTDMLKRRASAPLEKELRPGDRDLSTYFSQMKSVAQ
ncbi:MAG: hypothetical protein K940chlam2_00243 [Chlamydiae bacterium]|nr:hypothetical protein [Chlamydiota bacterium]